MHEIWAGFQVVAGERRLRAIRDILHWPDVPCLVRILSDAEASALMLTENCARADLNPIDEARAYETRMTLFGWSAEEIAKIAGVSRELVLRRVHLLKLRPEIQQLVAAGHLLLAHADCLASLDNNRQLSALRILQEAKAPLPLKTFQAIVARLRDEQNQEAFFDLAAYFTQQVAEGAALSRRGQKAVVAVPTRADLPAVTMPDSKATAATTIEDYIRQLEAAGLHSEAATIGTLYAGLVRLNYLATPLALATM